MAYALGILACAFVVFVIAWELISKCQRDIHRHFEGAVLNLRLSTSLLHARCDLYAAGCHARALRPPGRPEAFVTQRTVYRVVQPWGKDRGRDATVIGEHPTAADAFDAIERLALGAAHGGVSKPSD